MEEFRVKFIYKDPSTEVNLAKILQANETPAADLLISRIEEEKQSTVHEGPKKSEAFIGSRITPKHEKFPEYKIERSGSKPKIWKGRSEESNKYALLQFDGSEYSLILLDHWYKFTPDLAIAKLEPRSEITVGKQKRQREIMKVEEEIFGRDSEEEEQPLKVRVLNEKVREAEREGMDFEDEFDDDEDNYASDEGLVENTSLTKTLSSSGKDMQKMLQDRDSESESESDSNNFGLSSDESEESSKQLKEIDVVNELLRMGRVKVIDLYRVIKSKFKFEGSLEEKFTEIIKEVADVDGTGSEEMVMLKDHLKKSVPEHGARILFHTNSKKG